MSSSAAQMVVSISSLPHPSPLPSLFDNLPISLYLTYCGTPPLSLADPLLLCHGIHQTANNKHIVQCSVHDLLNLSENTFLS